jgi:hypothetical protein
MSKKEKEVIEHLSAQAVKSLGSLMAYIVLVSAIDVKGASFFVGVVGSSIIVLSFFVSDPIIEMAKRVGILKSAGGVNSKSEFSFSYVCLSFLIVFFNIVCVLLLMLPFEEKQKMQCDMSIKQESMLITCPVETINDKNQ